MSLCGTGVTVAVTVWSLQHHSVTVSARSCSTVPRGATARGCHTVSLSPRAARGVTAAAWPRGATQCHCSSHGLSQGVSVTAWRMGCHTVPCHCMAHGCHPASRHRRPAAHGTALPSARGLRVSPSVAVTAWPVGCHAASLHRATATPLHILWAATPVTARSPTRWGMRPHGPRAGPTRPPRPCPPLPGKQ